MFEFFPEEMPPKTCMQMTIKAQTFNNFVITFYISFCIANSEKGRNTHLYLSFAAVDPLLMAVMFEQSSRPQIFKLGTITK